MKSLLFLFFLITTLFAVNPKVFPQLGDRLYNHMYGMERLREIEEFAPYRVELDHYILELQKAKQKGFDIEYKRSNDAQGYLKLLRQLAKQDQFYVKKAYEVYHKSMKNKEFDLFRDIVNSRLIDIEEEKKKILDFYFRHKQQIKLGEGTILASLVHEEELRRKPKHSAEYYKKLREAQEKRKIERLRQKERMRMEQRKKALELELKRKKERIRQEQLKQLHEDI